MYSFIVTSQAVGPEIYGDYASARETLLRLRQVATMYAELEDGVKRLFVINGGELTFTSGQNDFCVNGIEEPSLEEALRKLKHKNGYRLVSKRGNCTCGPPRGYNS